MNVVDIIIIILLIFGALIGAKRGFTKQLVSCLGFIVVVILAFLLKNPVSIFLYEHLPFFSFAGIFEKVSILNILLYEAVAFLLVLFVLMIFLRLLLFATSIFEKFLTATIILGIPSKILGALLGLLESFIWIFILLYVLSLPFFNIKIIEDSSFREPILTKTPILSNFTLDNIEFINEFSDLKDKYKEKENSNEFNLEALDLFLKYEIITVDGVEVLIEKDKIQIENIDTVLKKYS